MILKSPNEGNELTKHHIKLSEKLWLQFLSLFNLDNKKLEVSLEDDCFSLFLTNTLHLNAYTKND